MAESVTSLTAQLAAIDAAIVKAETAQSVNSDGTSISRATLDTLYKRRDLIARRLDDANTASAGRSRLYARGRTKYMGAI